MAESNKTQKYFENFEYYLPVLNNTGRIRGPQQIQFGLVLILKPFRRSARDWTSLPAADRRLPAVVS
jgi:hypothetical protein